MSVKLTEKELLDMYYRHLEGKYFLDALKNYCNGNGFGGSESVWCVFAGELDEWEEGYFGDAGVCYFFDYPAVEEDQTLVLDYLTFYQYLNEASKDYLIRNPIVTDEVEARLMEIKQKFNIA
ncbi:hypothetical protein A3842_00695 [Paenibacillus sp. P3E]|uniref:ribonuclease toxin immunity protein CdiI n=1 Tax=unclassified Paenibacillus TaxID=185978 RepID=UPI00093F25C7|nr:MULTISPECIES: ribonuclease toxin immunity protein CdiI [unclassified Paenibacillus]OKP83023.1 hypothetical protein A3848_27340 [Paenibacillus sp. P32E]OKP93197.1 hypothetical protein A3842_00695 [Paenibacillus sp. P3E]